MPCGQAGDGGVAAAVCAVVGLLDLKYLSAGRPFGESLPEGGKVAVEAVGAAAMAGGCPAAVAAGVAAAVAAFSCRV